MLNLRDYHRLLITTESFLYARHGHSYVNQQRSNLMVYPLHMGRDLGLEKLSDFTPSNPVERERVSVGWISELLLAGSKVNILPSLELQRDTL